MIREIPYKTACFWAIYQAAVEEGIVEIFDVQTYFYILE